MKFPKILSPVNCIEDINFVAKTGCKNIYIYHTDFINQENNFNLILDYINKAKQYDFEFFINFKNNIKDNEIPKVKKLLEFLANSSIDGILVNSFDVLELIKQVKFSSRIFIDSGLNIHNLAGVEFLNLFYPVENINITEEIYIKNILKIKKYTKNNLSIDSDNFSWIAEQIVKNKKIIDTIVIKGDFENSEKLLEGIEFVEKIIQNPKIFKDKKLPFKNLENSHYKSNHFSGEFLNAKGNDFDFTGNIQQFNWKFKRVKLIEKPNKQEIKNLPRLNLKLTSLDQLNYLKKYIKKLNFNPVYSVEYGEIINTADLAKSSFNKIIEKVRKFCFEYDIKFQLSTPRILKESDFDRVYEYVKLLCLQSPYPSSVIVNNIGYWYSIINDTDFDNIPLELGQGLNLLNSNSISYLINDYKISTVNLSNIQNIKDIELCISSIKDKIPAIKLTIAGNIKVPCSGLCPLNNNSAVLSRLSCTAPCHRKNYAISDPTNGEIFPIAVDGFCRMHLFKDKILDLFKYLDYFQNIGVNEFVINFSGLPANSIPVLLNRFLNSFNSKENPVDKSFTCDQYEINLK